MKTVEEKHNAVMTELNRLLSEQKIGDLPSWPSYPQLKDTEELFALQIGDIGLPRIVSKVSPREFTKFHERIFDDFYRLLGLSERDAVAELREESDKYFTELKAERARNAALVAALKEMEEEIADYLYEDGERPDMECLLIGIESVLAANEKGGINAEIKRLRDGISELRDWDYPNQTHIEKCNALLSPAPVTEGKSHGEAITSKPKPREPITALEAMSRLKSENEVRKLESETRILHELFHQVGNSTWVAKGCAEITLEANGTWTLERIGKKGKKAIIINKPLWQCLQKAKAIIEKLGSHKNEDQE